MTPSALHPTYDHEHDQDGATTATPLSQQQREDWLILADETNNSTAFVSCVPGHTSDTSPSDYDEDDDDDDK